MIENSYAIARNHLSRARGNTIQTKGSPLEVVKCRRQQYIDQMKELNSSAIQREKRRLKARLARFDSKDLGSPSELNWKLVVLNSIGEL